MKISLFQGILLGVFGVAALIGLFVFATYSNSGGAAAQVGTVTIWGTLPAAPMNATLAAAAQIDTRLKNVSYTQVDLANFKSNLTAAIATGAAPDLVLISQEQLASLAGVLSAIPSSTISARSFSSTFAGECELFALPDGSGFYGVPFLIDPLVLYENRTILASDGIAQPPASWETLTGLVPHVAILGNGGGLNRGLIALGTYGNVTDARGILSALFLQTGVALSARGANGQLAADLGTQANIGGVPAGQAVLRFYTQFADSSKVSYTWNASMPNSQQAFLDGDLALYLGYASESRYLTQANPNLDFDTAPLPQPATASTRTTYGLAYSFAIPRGAPNASGAYFAAAALSATAIQQAAAAATGLAPASRAALASVPADPQLAVAYASALYARGWLSPAPTDTDSIFSGMITGVISGRYTLDAALGSAERSLDALLQ
jgi:ABC-type glycerol-3-phosphate transport system substrate-binding protein